MKSNTKSRIRIRKDDTVMVISGNNKGDTGRVLEIYHKTNRILVEGINIRKRHTKPNQNNQEGGILSKELPIDISNVMLIDSDKNPTRLEFRKEEVNGKMISVRYAKSNGKKI